MLSSNNKSKTYANALPTNKISTTATTGINKPLTLAENTTLKPAETGQFFVQVGAFSDYEKAQSLADSMKRFGNVSIFEAYLSKDGVYRVRLGAYNSRNEALKILDRLLDYGHSDVSIIQG